jgi:hypothetical protein
LALPPLPAAVKSSASGAIAELASAGDSSARSSSSLRMLALQLGSVRPSNTSIACSGFGARPATATSMCDRSPRATSPTVAAVRPRGAGSTAVTVTSVS